MTEKVKNTRGQEEMFGFALIIVLVSVILLIFLGFMLRQKPQDLDTNYEVENFIQGFLQYTTDCANTYEPNYYSIEKLIIACDNLERCSDGRNTCQVLDLTLRGICDENWKIYEGSFIQGYKLEIMRAGGEMLSISKGGVTSNYRGGLGNIGGTNDLQVRFRVYN